MGPEKELNAGTIDDHEVTFADDGKGGTYLSDGDKTGDAGSFWGTDSDKGHDHYGSGDGPNDNGTDRGQYTGPGSSS
jgi:hypothetical protein